MQYAADMRDAGDADDGPPSGKDQVLLKKTGRIIQKSSLFKKASTPIAIPTTPVILRQTQPLMGIRPDAIPDQLLAVAVEKEKGSMYNRNNLNQEIKKSPIKNNAPSPSSGATIDSNAKRQKTDNSLEQDSEEKISHVRENKKILDKISGEILETDLVKVPKVLKTVLPFKTNATRMIPPSLTRSSAKLITTAAEARKSLIRNEISVEPKKLIPSTKLDLSIHNRGSRSHQSKDESKISEELPEHTNRAAAGNEWTDATLADWDPSKLNLQYLSKNLRILLMS